MANAHSASCHGRLDTVQQGSCHVLHKQTTVKPCLCMCKQHSISASRTGELTRVVGHVDCGVGQALHQVHRVPGQARAQAKRARAGPLVQPAQGVLKLVPRCGAGNGTWRACKFGSARMSRHRCTGGAGMSADSTWQSYSLLTSYSSMRARQASVASRHSCSPYVTYLQR